VALRTHNTKFHKERPLSDGNSTAQGRAQQQLDSKESLSVTRGPSQTSSEVENNDQSQDNVTREHSALSRMSGHISITLGVAMGNCDDYVPAPSYGRRMLVHKIAEQHVSDWR